MSVQYNRDRKYITENLVGDQDKWDRLTSLLSKGKSEVHSFFRPDDAFYALSLPEMTEAMLDYMGLHIGTDRLHAMFSKKIKQPGWYFEQKGVHCIQIKQSYERDPQSVAAILAHELVHYVLIGGLNYRLAKKSDNEQLADLATVYTGLGIVVLNGLHRKNRRALLLSRRQQFSYYEPHEYAQLVVDYIKSYNITSRTYAGYIMPSTMKFLPPSLRRIVKKNAHRTKVAALDGRRQFGNRVLATVMSIALVAALAGGSYVVIKDHMHKLTPLMQKQAAALKSDEQNAHSGYVSCENQLNADKSALDQTSAQMAAYSAENDATDYNKLVSQHNQENNVYNYELTNCSTLRTQQNIATSAYSSYLRRHE